MSTLKIHNFHIHILYKLASNRNTELKEVTKFETAERIYEYQATTAKSIYKMEKKKKKRNRRSNRELTWKSEVLGRVWRKSLISWPTWSINKCVVLPHDAVGIVRFRELSKRTTRNCDVVSYMDVKIRIWRLYLGMKMEWKLNLWKTLNLQDGDWRKSCDTVWSHLLFFFLRFN